MAGQPPPQQQQLLSEERLQQVLEQALQQLQAGTAQRGWNPPWVGPLLFLLLALFLALLAVATYVTAAHRLEERRKVTAAAAAADGEDLARLCQSLPAWALNPDASSCVWINSLLAQLWPHAERFACRFLMADGFLESQLNSTSFWRPRVLSSSYFRVQGVALGQEPPRVTGIKTFPKQGGLQDEALLEYSFAWDSKLEVKLLVTLLGKAVQKQALREEASGGGGGTRSEAKWSWRALLSHVSRVKVGISEVAIRGTMRVALRPLLDDFPFAGAVKGSLVGAPDISYAVNVLGGDPYLVPGVKLWVDSFVREVMLPFTFPDGLTYDLASNTLTPFEKPEGLLEVAIVEATHVPRMDLLGKADPYVKLWVRETNKLQTAIKSRTLSPVWNENFSFLVHSSEHQQLTLELFDSDTWPNPDDLIGRITLPLTALDLSPGAVNDLWLPVPRNGKQPRRSKHHEQARVQAVALGHLVSSAAASSGSGSGSGGGSSGGGSRGDSRGGRGGRGGGGSRGAPLRVAPREDTAGSLSRPPQCPPSPFAGQAAGQAAGSAASAQWQAAGAAVQAQLDSAAQGRAAAQSPVAAQGLGQAQAQGQGQAAAPAQGQEQPAQGQASGALPLLRAPEAAWETLRRLASNPLEALRSRGCMLHVVASFYPLSEQEIAEVAREASRQRGEGAAAPPSRMSSVLSTSRVSNMLRGGVLYVYLDRAANLSSSTGFTRNMKVDVIVGGLRKSTERGKVPFRHRMNPVFDETIELVIPGAVAQRADATVEVEVWVQHFVLKDSFKGRISIPLEQVIRKKKLRDTWPLRDCTSERGSSITMELSWLSTLSM